LGGAASQPVHKKQRISEGADAVVRVPESGDGRAIKWGEKVEPPSPHIPSSVPCYSPARTRTHKQVLVTLSGTQGTALVNCAMAVVANYGCPIQDISFSRIEHTLTVGVLVEVTSRDIGIFKDFIEAGSKLEATVNFDVQTSKPGENHSLEAAPYENRVPYFATIINENGLQAKTIAELTWQLQELKISVTRGIRLTKRTFNVLELKLSIPEDNDLSVLRERLFALR